jgi:osmotically-inducible protein OsmY
MCGRGWRSGVVTLEGRLERRSQLRLVVDRVRDVDGTIDVTNRLSWTEDDEAVELGPIPRVGF